MTKIIVCRSPIRFMIYTFALWMDHHLNISNHMTKSIYVVVMRIIMMPSCPYFYFLSTPLPLNMRTYLLLSAFRLRTSEVYAWGSWYVHFASWFYIDIYRIMDCYFTLCHNTYGYSLLFYKVYIRRENAGSWNSGLEKEQILETYSVKLQKSWNSTGHLKINKEKSSPKMKARGPTPC